MQAHGGLMTSGRRLGEGQLTGLDGRGEGARGGAALRGRAGGRPGPCGCGIRKGPDRRQGTSHIGLRLPEMGWPLDRLFLRTARRWLWVGDSRPAGRGVL